MSNNRKAKAGKKSVLKDMEVDLFSLEEEPAGVDGGEWNFFEEVERWATERLQDEFQGHRCMFGEAPFPENDEAMMMVGYIEDIFVSSNFEGDGVFTVEIETKDENTYSYNMGSFVICLYEDED